MSKPSYKDLTQALGETVAVLLAFEQQNGPIVMTVSLHKEGSDEKATLLQIDTEKKLPQWNELLLRARGE